MQQFPAIKRPEKFNLHLQKGTKEIRHWKQLKGKSDFHLQLNVCKLTFLRKDSSHDLIRPHLHSFFYGVPALRTFLLITSRPKQPPVFFKNLPLRTRDEFASFCFDRISLENKPHGQIYRKEL